jgi:hypothetical protein
MRLCSPHSLQHLLDRTFGLRDELLDECCEMRGMGVARASDRSLRPANFDGPIRLL